MNRGEQQKTNLVKLEAERVRLAACGSGALTVKVGANGEVQSAKLGGRDADDCVTAVLKRIEFSRTGRAHRLTVQLEAQPGGLPAIAEETPPP